MAENTVNFTGFASFDVPADKVWDALIRFDDKTLYLWNDQQIRSADGRSWSGTVSFRGTPFRLNASPYDIRMTSPRTRLGIRVKPAEPGCTVIVACAGPGDAPEVSKKDTDAFLSRLRKALGTEDPVTETVPAKTSPSRSQEVTSPIPETSKKSRKRSSGKSSSGGSIAVLILLAALAAAGVFLTMLGLRDTRSSSAVPVIYDGPYGSDRISVDSAVLLEPGLSRSAVESSLGQRSEGTKARSVYLSSDVTEYGTPSVAVQVIYDGDTASEISILDLSQASSVGRVTGTALSPASSMEELEQQAGTKVSLVRIYDENGITVREYHFGYIDPLFNFSPSWEGQLWAKIGSDGSFTSGTGYRYDGSDPLFHSRLSDVSGYQYDSFDDYMDDFKGYLFCLRFKAQPDRYMSTLMIPDLAFSRQVDETSLYDGSSSFRLADGSPVWAYTAGFGIRGDLVLFSAVNRRLWQKEDQLNGTSCASVRSGMASSEALYCMGILPSMVYIDHSYITLGFGRLLPDTDVLTEQFEFCIRFSITDDVVESIYDNTGTQLVID